MRQWMGEPEMQVEVTTNWQVGQPILISGFHHVKFENRGTVLRFEPGRLLSYNYLSSVSRLPAVPENHTVLEFELIPAGAATTLQLTASSFPTQTIFKQVEFYWKSTLPLIRQRVETTGIDAAQP